MLRDGIDYRTFLLTVYLDIIVLYVLSYIHGLNIPFLFLRPRFYFRRQISLSGILDHDVYDVYIIQIVNITIIKIDYNLNSSNLMGASKHNRI